VGGQGRLISVRHEKENCMQGFRMKRPSAGMVVAFVALVAALSGTAVALPGSNSVNSGDIKNNTITSSDIKNNSVKSTDVKNGSLLSKDFKSGQLPAGPAGAAGAAGPAGPAGSALAFAHINDNGTIDAANSKNMAVQDNPANGEYCLIVPPGSRSITATVDLGQNDNYFDDGVATATFDPTFIHTGELGCPSESNAAVVTFSPYYVGGQVQVPVYVVVN
jgi:hypothetical protein